MQILLIHQHYYPEQGGTAKTSTEMAEYLAAQGHDVTVVTEYPHRGFQSSVETDTLQTEETRNQVKLYRLQNSFTYSKSTLTRVLAYLHFTVSSFIKVLFLRRSFDVCITVQALPAAIPGVLLQLTKGIRHHFYCTDMMPDLGVVTGLREKSVTVRLASVVERLVYAKSHAVYAVTPRMAVQIRARTHNPNIFILPDWLDTGLSQDNKYKYLDELRSRFGLMGKRVILYVGNIGFLQNLQVLVDVGARLQQEPEFADCMILIGGSGVERDKLEMDCLRRGIHNVRFLGVVKREHVPSLMELSSVLVMNFVNHPHMALYRSSKIMDYIMAEKPVVVGAEGELADIVSNYHLGAVARPSDASDFYAKLRQVLEQQWVIDNTELIRSFEKTRLLQEFSQRLASL